MALPQEHSQEAVANLPDDCTLDEFRYRLYVRRKAEEGLRAIELGRTWTHEQAVEMVKSWRKSGRYMEAK